MKEGARLLRAILVSLLATAAAAWARGATSQTGPTGHQGCPDEPAWTGNYRDYNDGFSITIPESLKGFWNGSHSLDSANGCVRMSDHGRTMPLTAEPHDPLRLIEVYAGYADEAEVTHVVSFELGSMRRNHPKTLELGKRSAFTLSGLEGQRVVVRYFDAQLRRLAEGRAAGP